MEYKIKYVSEITNISESKIRYYEKMVYYLKLNGIKTI